MVGPLMNKYSVVTEFKDWFLMITVMFKSQENQWAGTITLLILKFPDFVVLGVNCLVQQFSTVQNFHYNRHLGGPSPEFHFALLPIHRDVRVTIRMYQECILAKKKKRMYFGKVIKAQSAAVRTVRFPCLPKLTTNVLVIRCLSLCKLASSIWRMGRKGWSF